MNQPLILVNRDQPEITIITLNRPEKRNALSIALMEEFNKALEDTRKDTTQRVLIIKAAGPVFCTGMDLKETYDPDKIEISANYIEKTFTSIYTMPIITIAAVHGAALAGGAGLMSVCDMVIAAEGTQIGFPEVRRGLVAAIVITFLRRLIRERDIRELVLFGNSIEATQALHMGLINRIVPLNNLEAIALQFAHEALKGAPGAIADTKRLIANLHPISIDDELKAASSYHLKARCTDECREGINAFLEKRDPLWTKSHHP